MPRENRKAAIGAYKERKTVAGIYAVRCMPTDAAWVGHAPDLSTIQNRLWFSLRFGNSTHRSLQAAWDAHRAEAFAFEIVERLDGEKIDYIRDRLMQSRLLHWVEALRATRI